MRSLGGAHSNHARLDGFPDAVLYDGCRECERRALGGLESLLELDVANLDRLWKLMLQREGKLDEPLARDPTDAEALALGELYCVAVLLERTTYINPWVELPSGIGLGIVPAIDRPRIDIGA